MNAAERAACPECDANLFPADLERGTCPACGADLETGEGGDTETTDFEGGEIGSPKRPV